MERWLVGECLMEEYSVLPLLWNLDDVVCSRCFSERRKKAPSEHDELKAPRAKELACLLALGNMLAVVLQKNLMMEMCGTQEVS